MSYFNSALTPTTRMEVVTAVVNAVAPLQPQAIAVQGISGTAVGTIVAHLLNIPLLVVKKEGDNSHRMDPVVPYSYHHLNVIIVDDFIASGATVCNIMAQLRRRDHHILAVVLYLRTQKEVDRKRASLPEIAHLPLIGVGQ